MHATVKARRVADSIVVTLPKNVLSSSGINEGDLLMVQTEGSGHVSVRKEKDDMSKLKELKMELKILRKRLEVLNVDRELALHEYKYTMPTRHPGIEQGGEIVEGTMLEMRLDEHNIELEIAKKELAIYRIVGTETENE